MSKRRRTILTWIIGMIVLGALSRLPGTDGVFQASVLPWLGQGGQTEAPQVEETTGATAALAATPTATAHPYEQQVVNLVNQWRGRYGLPPLQVDPRLAQAADNHNAAMIAANSLTHQATGELPLCASGAANDRYDTVAYPWADCRENIAYGQTTPAQVVDQWMGSLGHCLNILAPDVKEMGVGYAVDASNRPWWTQDFGAQPGQVGPFATATSALSPGPCPVSQTPTPLAQATNTPGAATATRTPAPAASATRTPVPPPTRTPTAVPATATAPAAGAADKPAVFRQGTWLLRNSLTTGPADIAFTFGAADDLPLMCDWDGNGTKTPGVYRASTSAFYLRNSNSPGNPDIAITFGTPGDVPVCGDWNGDGTQTVGIFRPSTAALYLRNSNTTGPADLVFLYGLPGDVFISGDWNGDRVDTVGIRRGTTWFLKNSNVQGGADFWFDYGATTDTPVAGDWNGNGDDTAGIFRAGTWFLRNSNTTGPSEIAFTFGTSGDRPLVWR